MQFDISRICAFTLKDNFQLTRNIFAQSLNFTSYQQSNIRYKSIKFQYLSYLRLVI